MIKLIIPMILTVSGCAHISVAAYNNEAHTVSIEASKRASDDKIEAVAKDFCHSAVRMLGKRDQGSGIYLQNGNFTTEIRRDYYTFRCLGANSYTLE